MFTKAALFAIATLAVFTSAAPSPGGGSGISDSCNAGPVQCCNSVQSKDSKNVSALASLLKLDLSGFTGQVGLQCSPLTAIGLGGGAKCGSQPVCCSNNTFNGLIAMGCSPVNVNL